jgi:hypothetical protein
MHRIIFSSLFRHLLQLTRTEKLSSFSHTSVLWGLDSVGDVRTEERRGNRWARTKTKTGNRFRLFASDGARLYNSHEKWMKEFSFWPFFLTNQFEWKVFPSLPFIFHNLRKKFSRSLFRLKSLLSFLRLKNFYCRHAKNFSHLAQIRHRKRHESSHHKVKTSTFEHLLHFAFDGDLLCSRSNANDRMSSFFSEEKFFPARSGWKLRHWKRGAFGMKLVLRGRLTLLSAFRRILESNFLRFVVMNHHLVVGRWSK